MSVPIVLANQSGAFPTGGATGQAITKKSNEDYDAQWTNIVNSFNNRTGNVTPKAGDYTAADVGAVPTTRKVNGKALSTDIELNADDVGASPSEHEHDYLPLSGGTLTGPLVVDANITGKYLQGTWLKTTSATQYNSNTGKIAVIDSSGWVYWRSPENIRSDIGALASDETATSATKLATSRNIQTNLGSTSAAGFDGTSDITPGVTGTLPVANGGTGATTAANARTNLGIQKTIYVQTTAPTDTTNFWLDTSTASGGILKYYSSGWKPIKSTWG